MTNKLATHAVQPRSRHTDRLVLQFNRIIKNNTFWMKYRDTIIGVLVGFFVSFVYHVLKGVYDAHRPGTIAFFAGVAFAVAGIWIAVRLRSGA